MCFNSRAAKNKETYVEEQLNRPALRSLAYAPSYTASPRRVLVVEDGLDAVRALAALLQDMGHKVMYAINGYAGIEIARRFVPDFVLLDLGLLGIDGYEVCRQLKREPALKNAH